MRQSSASAPVSTADHRRAMSDPSRALTNQFLLWMLVKPRGYREVMDAWRTTCPRLTIWEDALDAGLVQVRSGKTLREATVAITQRGIGFLSESTNE